MMQILLVCFIKAHETLLSRFVHSEAHYLGLLDEIQGFKGVLQRIELADIALVILVKGDHFLGPDLIAVLGGRASLCLSLRFEESLLPYL